MQPKPETPMNIYPQNSTNSGSKGKQPVRMDSDDVVEIKPPTPDAFRSRSSRDRLKLKQKAILHHEVIDVEKYEDSADIIILDEPTVSKNKRKAVKDNFDGCNQVKSALPNHPFGLSPANVIDLDGPDTDLLFHGGSVSVDAFSGDFMDFDYSFAQAYYESTNIPPGVEAPIPFLGDSFYNAKQVTGGGNSSNTGNQMHSVGLYSSKPSHVGKNPSSASSSSFQTPVKPLGSAFGVGPSSSDDFMDFDDYAYLQAYFESANIPPGVEASIPALQDSLADTKNAVHGSGSENINNQKRVSRYSTPAHVRNNWSSESSLTLPMAPKSYTSQGSQSSSLPLPHISNMSKNPESSSILPVVPKSYTSQGGQSSSFSMPQISKMRKTPASPLVGGPSYLLPMQNTKTSGFSSSHGSVNHTNNMMSNDFGYAPFGHFPPIYNQSATSNLLGGNIISSIHHSMPWHTSTSTSYDHGSFPAAPSPILSEGVARTPKDIKEEDIVRNFRGFRKFDTVEDHADHHYSSKGSSATLPPKNWAKKIQEEWKILENDLPDSIFVRVYESRMDLLRAVIVGADGTPYHNGLFFFDIFFPAGYPNVPPLVYYHSWGLRLNPNLYSNGYVCLSLLGTWSGSKNEKWLPGVSTVLQVLVSIQALVLNQKPYFNEPGFARSANTASGETRSTKYSENTFFLSLKTMVNTMRRPPKHFNDFVVGHFHKHARDILMECKAYADGAQVGCLVKGVNKNARCVSSRSFKDSLPSYVDMLVKEFSAIGVKDVEKFEVLAKATSNQVGNMPPRKAAI
ncbi:hypothetical protein Tsubulata_030444 [Turnera subulata]|uniref:E2 ubiquitin-conjugating enzyme n=1 Tax=Turnera subulata TaxID=218843 RepID=A0A9Q0G726_9ROSI|nr:hypothetical protein Tsubulata_030444 [Turnera subulata]